MYLLYLGPGLIRTVLIIVVIYYAIRLFSRHIAPILLDKGVKKMQQKMQDQQRQHQQPFRADGEVTIEADKKGNQKPEKDKGEYVDFEEVE